MCCHEGVSFRPIHVLTAGVPLGEVKGRDAVPSAALALSTALRPEAFATVDLPRPEALRYLRREALINAYFRRHFLPRFDEDIDARIKRCANAKSRLRAARRRRKDCAPHLLASRNMWLNSGA